MPLHLLPSLLLYILMVGYTPGPANLYALSCSLKYGRKSALRMWYGELCGFLIAVTLVSIATHLVGAVMGEYVEWLKYVGATYILWLAYNIYKSKGLAENEAQTCSFTSGMIVQLTNAKMLLFDLTIFSMFVLPYSNSLVDLLIVGYILTLAGPTANLVWLLAGAWMRKWFVHYKRKTDIIMSVLLALCAIAIII